MSATTFLATGPARPPACPCGSIGTDRRTHTRRHMQWATGVAVPGGLDAAWPPDTIAVIATTGPIAWRRLAYELAQVARRAGDYDAASFPAPSGLPRPDGEKTRALLYRHGDVVAGYLVLVDASTAGRYHLTGRQHTNAGRGQVRPTVGPVFVAYHLRRGGIGRALVQAAAEHTHVTPAELAWWTPFTDAGAALARSAAGPDGGVWIA